MEKKSNEILNKVADYYAIKLEEHGTTAKGVDWNGGESQSLRFEQLTKIISQTTRFSVNDLGCGYGALFDFLSCSYNNYEYYGVDISEDMVRAAQNRYDDCSNANFSVSAEPTKIADYGIASGILNVRLGCSDKEWHEYLEATLDVLNRTSRKGFTFNCLTSYSDADKIKDYLYYADPCEIFDLCKRKYSRHIALLHDYGLFEFTVLVRKKL